MKVCLFNAIKSWGGGEKWHFETAMGLANRDVDVCAIVGRGGVLEGKMNTNGIPSLSINITNSSFLNPFKIFTLYSYLRRANIDLIVFNSSRDVKIGVIASKLARVKVLVYRRGSPTPIKASVINRLIIGQVSCMLCNSKATRSAVLGLKPWIDPNKVFVIYNGVAIQSLKTHKDDARSKVVIGSAGRLFQEKGHRYLIEALSLLDNSLDVELRIAGDGKLKAELVQLTVSLGISSKVKFLGFVEDMDAFFSGLDLFVMPSVWEGFGFALVEAMLHEKPVVAFDTGSIPEIVTDGDDGFIVDFGDTAALSTRIEWLVTEQSERMAMGQRARQNMISRFSQEKAIGEIETLFRQLIGKNS